MKFGSPIIPLTLIFVYFYQCHAHKKEGGGAYYYEEGVAQHVIQKRTPLDIGGRRNFDSIRNKWKNDKNEVTTSKYSSDNSVYNSDQSSASGKNSSLRPVFTGNPDEYTIGGVLSGAPDVEFYFTQILSVRNIIFKRIFSLIFRKRLFSVIESFESRASQKDLI